MKGRISLAVVYCFICELYTDKLAVCGQALIIIKINWISNLLDETEQKLKSCMPNAHLKMAKGSYECGILPQN